jgi:L-rhamnose-H+ transport protein
VFAGAGIRVLAIPAVFGVFWGIGVTLFGVGANALGLSLSYAIVMGGVISFGSFIPMLLFHPEDFTTPRGILVLVGLLIVLAGIAVIARAGIMREKDMKVQEEADQTGNRPGIPAFAGVIICVIGGLLSALPNVAFTMSQRLIDLSIAHGASTQWAGNSVWAAMFSVGMIPNVLYCIILMRKNRTFRNFTFGKPAVNLLLAALMGILWLGSMNLYGMGVQIMGAWGAIVGWGVICALTIATSNVIGFASGEWKGALRRSRVFMVSGLGIVLAGIVVFSISSTL